MACLTAGPGEYDHAKLVTHGAMNDDCESVVVAKGCSAVISEHGEHGGWEAALTDSGGEKGDGRYTMKDLEAVGAKPVRIALRCRGRGRAVPATARPLRCFQPPTRA